MYIEVTGISFKSAPLEMQEKFALSSLLRDQLYEKLLQDPLIRGVAILSTCHRTEIYTSCQHLGYTHPILNRILSDLISIDSKIVSSYSYYHPCEKGIQHLFSVSSGLDSLLIGEDEILHQIRLCYKESIQKKGCDKILHSLFQKALFVGKKVRTETPFNQNSLSFGGLSIDLAISLFGSIANKKLLVIGSGEMGKIVATRFLQKGIGSLQMTTRSETPFFPKNSAPILPQFLPMDQVKQALSQVDICICCTNAGQYIITPETFRTIEHHATPLLIIDLSVPRNVSPDISNMEGIIHYDLTSFETLVQENYSERKNSTAQVSQIIAKEVQTFLEDLSTFHIDPAIQRLKEMGEQIKEEELQRALNRLQNPSDFEKTILRDMAHSILYRLIHNPIDSLKNRATGDFQYLDLFYDLFQLPIPEKAKNILLEEFDE